MSKKEGDSFPKNIADRKDITIIAFQELTGELTTKLINLRVEAGLKIAELEAKIKDLKGDDSKLSGH